MNPKIEAAVMEWIEDTFDTEAVSVTDFMLFPAGKLLTDRDGGQLLVYWDILSNRVKTALPDKKQRSAF